jgi:hypothetical protein
MEELANETIDQICSQIKGHNDLANFAAVSKRIYKLAIVHLEVQKRQHISYWFSEPFSFFRSEHYKPFVGALAR